MVGAQLLDFTLPNLLDSKKEFTLGDYYGTAKDRKKAVIISFFGSWCKPCLKELPELEKLWKARKDKGLMIVDVCVDKMEAGKAKKQITDAKVTFPVIHDRLNIVKDRYGVKMLPRMFLADAEGKIIKVYFGFTPGIQNELETELDRLLGYTH